MTTFCTSCKSILDADYPITRVDGKPYCDGCAPPVDHTCLADECGANEDGVCQREPDKCDNQTTAPDADGASEEGSDGSDG